MDTHNTFQHGAGLDLPEISSITTVHEPTIKDVIANYERLKSAIARRQALTAEHSIRVRICATSLGFACRLTGSEITTLSIAAEIHDIGKLQMPTSILYKPEPLIQEEWAIMRKHPAWGAKVAAVSFPSMPEVARCIMLHHERLDATGYPNALGTDDIPFVVRILSVADAFSALTEERPFRRAYSEEDAFRIMMHDEAGRYDEFVLEILERIRLSR
jgi:HD-GYP domain-containing protein (c-di-GMP phosphodiesterase class II)